MPKLQLAKSDCGTKSPSRVGGAEKPAQAKGWRKPRLWLRRAFRRGVEVEYLIQSKEHLANCWLAAQQGAFPQHLKIPTELKGEEFGEALVEALTIAAHEAVLVFTPYGSTNKGRRAVALFSWRGEGRQIEPSVVWFPWASARNKLEAALKFLDEARRGERLALWYIPDRGGPDKDENERFMRHLARYCIVRFCGVVDDYYAPGRSAKLFFSRERKGL